MLVVQFDLSTFKSKKFISSSKCIYNGKIWQTGCWWKGGQWNTSGNQSQPELSGDLCLLALDDTSHSLSMVTVSASIRQTCSDYSRYTEIAKTGEDRKKREHYILLGNLDSLPKNLYNKVVKKKSPNKPQQNPKQERKMCGSFLKT